MDEQEFVQLLESLLLPDTERVKAATSILNKKYYPSPGSLQALIHILTTNENATLRQLAAVEGRKLVTKHWPSIPTAQKPAIRNQLLESTLKEEGRLVRLSTARVISQIARIDLEAGEWQDLPRLLQHAATSATVRHREVAMYILFALMEQLGDMFTDNLGELFTLFTKTIQDPESAEVRVNTMMALSRIAMLLDPEEDPKSVELFQDMLPGMVAVLKSAIDSGDDDHSTQAFEVFQILLGCDSSLLNKHFLNLVQFMINLASETDLDDDQRSQALSFLMQCVRIRKMKVQSLKIGEELTLKSLQIATELGDFTTDDEEITPGRSALGLLDILAQNLPPSQVLVPLLKAIGPYVTHSNPDYRRAGILALGMSVEGAPDFIATQLGEVLPMVLHLLEDPSAKVRAAALNCVARLSDDLEEDMGKAHAQLIPALVKNFDTAFHALRNGQDNLENLDILRCSCNAVDSLIEGIDIEEAAKYTPELVPRFSQLFTHDDHRARVAAIGAIGAIASASEDAFLPYLEATMHALAPYIPLKESQDDLEQRGVVTDSMGKIAEAVGAAPFQQYVRPLMEASEEALHLGHPRLRESSYILWSTMAKVYQESFSDYLGGVVKGLHECLEQEEDADEVVLGEEAADLLGTEVIIAGKKVKVAAATDDDDDDDIAGDGDDDWDDLEMGVTAVAMEKEIAIEVIGDVISHVKDKYLPYLQKSVELILALKDHGYEGIRKAAIGTLWRTYATLWGLAETNGMEKWRPGLPLQVQPTVDLANLGNLVMTATLGVWQDEIDRGTVTDINRDLSATLKLCGPAILVGENGSIFVPQISNQLLQLLTKKHPCQEGGDLLDDEEMLEESSEYDWLVIETALECLTCLSAALGPTFVELWKAFEKIVLKYAQSQETAEREAAVGTLAECIGNMGDAVTPFTSNLMRLLVRRVTDEDPQVKGNAVYGVGLLCQHSKDEAEVLRNLSNLLEKLEPLLEDDQPVRVHDNALGCVARMVARFPGRIPLGDILPTLVAALPIKEDFEENKPVFEMIVQLYGQSNAVMRQLTPQLAPVLQKVLGEPQEQLDEETRGKVLQLVSYLQSQGK